MQNKKQMTQEWSQPPHEQNSLSNLFALPWGRFIYNHNLGLNKGSHAALCAYCMFKHESQIFTWESHFREEKLLGNEELYHTGMTSKFWLSLQCNIKPLTYIGSRQQNHWQPVEIGAQGGTIMRMLSCRRTTPMTVTVLPSFTYLNVMGKRKNASADFTETNFLKIQYGWA